MQSMKRYGRSAIAATVARFSRLSAKVQEYYPGMKGSGNLERIEPRANRSGSGGSGMTKITNRLILLED